MNIKEPGSLAITIKSRAGNVGMIVDVISFMGDVKHTGYPGYTSEILGPMWLIQFNQPFHSRFAGNLHLHKAGQRIPYPDAWLKPVSGLDDPEYEEFLLSLPKEMETT